MLKKLGNKLAYILIGIVLAIAGTVYAANVSVPQATQQGQVPCGLTTGNYSNCKFINGSNVTIDTSTPGQITITSTGGSASAGGNNLQLQYNNSTALGGAELFYNKNLFTFGVNSTTPTAALTVQGTSTQPTLDILNVASSTGVSSLRVFSNGDVGVNNVRYTWPSVQGAQGLYLGNTASGTLSWLTPLYVTACPSGCNYTATGTNDQFGINNGLSGATGTLLLKAGTYNPVSAITLVNNNRFIGEGNGTKIVVPTAINGVLASGTVNTIIQNLLLDGSTETSTALNGDVVFRIRNSHNARVSNITCQNANGFCFFVDSLYNNSSTSAVTLTGSYLQGNGYQDVIGGGPHDTSGISTTSDITILGNTIEQTVNQGGTINSNFDANCLDMVGVHRFNISNNNCRGNLVFGSEQSPNDFSKITDNILSRPFGTTTVSSTITIQQDGASTSATTTPTNLMIAGNINQDGGISVFGNTTNPIQHLLIMNNSLRTASSTFQTENSIGQQGIYISKANNSAVLGNDLTAYPGASGVYGVQLSNVTSTVVAFNNITNFPTGVDLGNGAGNKSIFNNFEGVTTPVINGTNIIGMDDNGNVYIGTTTPTHLLEVAGTAGFAGTINVLGAGVFQTGTGGGSILCGADVNAVTITPGLRKLCRVTGMPYNAVAPNLFMFGEDIPASGASNDLYVGGESGASTLGMTAIHFSTVAATTTTGGVERMLIGSNGSTSLTSLGTGIVQAAAGSLYISNQLGNASATAFSISGNTYLTGLTGQNCIGTAASGLLQAGSCGGGSGNSAFTIGNGIIFNATSTDLIGLGSSTPTRTVSIKGKGGTNPFIITSSTDVTMLELAQNGSTTISSLTTGLMISTSGGSLYNYGGASNCGNATAVIGISVSGATTCSLNGLQAALTNPDTGTGTNGQVAYFTAATSLTSASKFLYNGTVAGWNATSSAFDFNIQATANITPFNIASSSGTSVFVVASSTNIGMGSTTPTADLTIQATSGGTNPVLTVATSTGATYLTILAGGNVGIGSSSPSSLFTVDAGTTVGTASTTVIIPQKFQIDTYNSAGTRVCMTIVGTTPTVTTGACP